MCENCTNTARIPGTIVVRIAGIEHRFCSLACSVEWLRSQDTETEHRDLLARARRHYGWDR